MNKQEYIICAALWYKDNKIYIHQPKNIETGLVICGLRHHNCSVILIAIIHKLQFKVIQGFLTSEDRFVNRQEAGEIAFKAGQIDNKTDCLFSEDLY